MVLPAAKWLSLPPVTIMPDCISRLVDWRFIALPATLSGEVAPATIRPKVKVANDMPPANCPETVFISSRRRARTTVAPINRNDVNRVF